MKLKEKYIIQSNTFSYWLRYIKVINSVGFFEAIDQVENDVNSDWYILRTVSEYNTLYTDIFNI